LSGNTPIAGSGAASRLEVERPRACCGVSLEAVAAARSLREREVGDAAARHGVARHTVAARHPSWPRLGRAGREGDKTGGREHGDAVAFASQDPVSGYDVVVSARDGHTDSNEARKCCRDRNPGPAAVDDRVRYDAD